jgi:hypothetical protein
MQRSQLRFSASCPHCGASAGEPCHNADGARLAGAHFQRSTTLRREIRAALAFYKSMGLRTKLQKVAVL